LRWERVERVGDAGGSRDTPFAGDAVRTGDDTGEIGMYAWSLALVGGSISEIGRAGINAPSCRARVDMPDEDEVRVPLLVPELPLICEWDGFTGAVVARMSG
jgi:hypothetical protein